MSEILYIGVTDGTSALRAGALRRLGHPVTHISPYEGLPPMWATWLNRLGGSGIDFLVATKLERRRLGRFALAIVDCGDVVGAKSLAVLRGHADKIVNINLDNPYKEPLVERRRWTLFRRAMQGYDMVATPQRNDTEAQLQQHGLAARSVQFWQAADEVAHRPLGGPQAVAPQWRSEVVFVGTWMPGRGEFLSALIARGVPLTIFGPRWELAPQFDRLARYIRIGRLDGADYASAIGGAKVALVLLNGANDDLHTTRSVEIPAIGTAMCAPRTSHHQALYVEDEEAMFFGDVEECVRKCRRLLDDAQLRAKVAQAGHRRTWANGTYNETLMKTIIEAAR